MLRSIINFTILSTLYIWVSIAVVWGVYSGYILYKEYINPPTVSIPQDVIDAKIAKLIAAEQARSKAEKEQLNEKYNLK